MDRHFLTGAKMALPAGISLIPLGISIGLVASQAGMSWLQAGLMTALVMCGSGEILALGMVMDGAPMYLILISVFFMSLKNMIFAGSAMERVGKLSPLRRMLCCANLCDVGAGLFCTGDDDSASCLIGINTVIMLATSLSSCAGAMMTEALPITVSNSFGIALYAVFLCMIIPGARSNSRLLVLLLFTAGLNWLLRFVLSSALALVVSMMLGAFIGVYFVDLEGDKKQKQEGVLPVKKILFVCHGNICRSPMAEFVMKDMVRRAGLEDKFEISSAATSSEELGNPVYPPARSKLREHDIDCSGKTARRIVKDDYEEFDLIIGMDSANMRSMSRVFGEDRDAKLSLLLDHAGREGESVADPWYTGDFEATWQDVFAGCIGLLGELCEEIVLDFSQCRERAELYEIMAERMLWRKDYGHNLDALYDILTGLPHLGRSFAITLPAEDAPCRGYAEKVCAVFEEAGVSIRLV
ncbi:MAG: AzlC family ABC transporter permease [Oscillospiraceae bacterium]|nr:AzlC family ABC transporter permease [Oscillospiraceae bacterium]